jgi:hypothetical protein
MWHKVEEIVQTYKLDPDLAAECAVKDANRFSIVEGRISTWHVDDFIKVVRSAEIMDTIDDSWA